MLRDNGWLTDVEIRRKCTEKDWHLDENGQELIRDQTEEQNNQSQHRRNDDEQKESGNELGEDQNSKESYETGYESPEDNEIVMRRACTRGRGDRVRAQARKKSDRSHV